MERVEILEKKIEFLEQTVKCMIRHEMERSGTDYLFNKIEDEDTRMHFTKGLLMYLIEDQIEEPTETVN